MVLGPYTIQEAALACQCKPDQLCPGPLGAVQEADKIRTIYDGSIGGQNAKIQQHTKEKTTLPTVADCIQALHWCSACAQSAAMGAETHQDLLSPDASGSDLITPRKHEDTAACGADQLQNPEFTDAECSDNELRWVPPKPGEQWVILKTDASKAHRRIKVLQQDWKYQVAVNKGKFWINKVGTYGMASAQLYWGRMAALLVRLLYALFPNVDWQFVYVDDFIWILRADSAVLMAVAILATLAAIGLPIAWHKTALLQTNSWLGFTIDTNGPLVSIPSKKLTDLIALLTKVQQGAQMKLADIVSLVGKVQWALSAAPYCKPLLQPWWTWMKAVKSAGRPPHLVRWGAGMLIQAFSRPTYSASPYQCPMDLMAASDASADPDSRTAALGGWFHFGPSPRQNQVRWFYKSINKDEHPWAFKEGNPQKRIAALELYGSLLLLLSVLQHQLPVALTNMQSPGYIPIPILTDNQSNALTMLANRSKKWPSAAILMELSLQLHVHQTCLAPAFIHRELNDWSDQLSKGDTSKFHPALQVDPVESFIILNDLLKESIGTEA